jgi:phosphoenolpyruvate carboxykinase (ATP)
LLDPRATWTNKTDYDKQAKELAAMFVKNFEKYANCVSKEILSAAPLVN